MLDTLHVVSTECPHATYVAHHMPQHCCMPCSDAHLPVSLHKPIRTAAVAQISATSGALNSVQPLALSIQCNFWHSQFSATSGTLNSVQLPALPTSSLHMAPNSQRHLYILLQSCFSTPTRPLRGRTGPPTHEVCKQVSQTLLQRTPFRVHAQNTYSMESTSTPSLQFDCCAKINQM